MLLVRGVYAGAVVGLFVAACAPSQPGAARPDPAGGAVSCDALQVDEEDPGAGSAPELCRHYREELLPAVADQATRCMQAARWSICDVSRCTTTALAAVPAEKDARCDAVEEQCPGMGPRCAALVSGMNVAGRERFAGCLVESCGMGVRACLWDRMVSPCDEQGPRGR